MRRRKIAWNYIRSWLVLDLTIVAIVWAPAIAFRHALEMARLRIGP